MDVHDYFYSSFNTKIGLMSYVWCIFDNDLFINALIKGKELFNDYLKRLKSENKKFVFHEEKNKNIEAEVNAYLAGRTKSINFKTLYLTGTDFQKKVWDGARRVNYAETACYQVLAESIFLPEAARAVGNALGKNPLILIVPCHRIIKKNKQVGFFSSGIWTKKFLLGLERKFS